MSLHRAANVSYRSLQDSNLFSIYVQGVNGSSEQLLSQSPIDIAAAQAEYYANRTGPGTSPNGFANAFQQLNESTLTALGATTILGTNRTAQAHIQYSHTNAWYPIGLANQLQQRSDVDYFSVSVTLLAPSSRGSVTISANSIQQPPNIDLNVGRHFLIPTPQSCFLFLQYRSSSLASVTRQLTLSHSSTTQLKTSRSPSTGSSKFASSLPRLLSVTSPSVPTTAKRLPVLPSSLMTKYWPIFASTLCQTGTLPGRAPCCLKMLAVWWMRG